MSPAERSASEALRLLSEPLLVEAIDSIMADAFAEFKDIEITPDNLATVIKLQARTYVAHEILDRLKAKITASGQHDGGVVVEMTPSA